MSTEAICDTIWGIDSFGYEKSLMVHIRNIREKIELSPSKPHHLITVKGLGYKLVIWIYGVFYEYFQKGILKFILAFLTIILIDFVLLVATTNFIRSQQSPIDIIQGVSSNITPSNGTYKVNQTAKKLIKKHNLWVMILDQKVEMKSLISKT